MKNPAPYPSERFVPANDPLSFASRVRKVFSRRPKVIFVMLLSVSLLLRSLPLFAQAPQQFSFQGVARGVDGKILVNKEIGYSFKIHKNNPVGTIKFTREGITTTDATGVFNLTIGTEANPIPGDIRWDRDRHYLEVGIDVDGAVNGFTFVGIGTTELISVPSALYAQKSGKWADGTPIVQTDNNNGYGNIPTFPSVGNGPRLIWHPEKAAFRAGLAENNFWDDAQIGSSSFASGNGTLASGTESTAMGFQTQATAQRAIAMGSQAVANGSNAIALGNVSNAIGGSAVSIGSNSVANANQSIAMGLGATSKSYSGIVTGNYNNISDNPNSVSAASGDRLFQIGNGTSNANRSNAMTVLRNGNIGIGSNVLVPEFVMDFGGRPRIRHNGATAGLFLNNSQNAPEGFVGMKTDNQIGLYLNGAWRLWVDQANNVWTPTGQLGFAASDKRLKTNITKLTNSLSSVLQLNGYHYYWSDKKMGTELQTGVIAQEVESFWPELISTGETGFKAVNYIGLIPHLIEAVKELDKKTQEITALKKELASMQEINKKLSALEASVKELLAGQAGTSTPTSK